MATKNILAAATVLLLCGCSMMSGDDDEDVRVVEEEEITVAKVYISKERLQCDDESGRTLDDTKADLENAGIKVFSSACGLITGKMSPALCGSTTLYINVHGIDEKKFPEAEAIGFKPLSGLKEEELGYDLDACN